MQPYRQAVIFAGGRSSRMGRDKSLLPFGEYTTLAEYQYQKLQNLFQDVAISTKEDKFPFKSPLIIDTYQEASPLIGILSTFETLPHLQSLFILSVDAPFVDTEIIHKIMEKEPHEADIIVAKSPSGIQPLCGLYKRTILSSAHALYAQNRHKLHDLLSSVNTETVSFAKDYPFTNLNHYREYEEALKQTLT